MHESGTLWVSVLGYPDGWEGKPVYQYTWKGGPVLRIQNQFLLDCPAVRAGTRIGEALVGKRIAIGPYVVLGLEWHDWQGLLAVRLDGWWRVYGYVRFVLYRLWRFWQWKIVPRLFTLLWVVGLAYNPARPPYNWSLHEPRLWKLVHPVRWVVQWWQGRKS